MAVNSSTANYKCQGLPIPKFFCNGISVADLYEDIIAFDKCLYL